MNELKIFENQDFGQVRTVVRDGAPWFVAADVCRILGHTNVSVALQMLDDDERGKQSLGQVSANGVMQNRETNIISEAGLYELVIRSNLPAAKAFKRWIAHEVIPSIRKHGAYLTPETAEKVLTDPTTIISICQNWKADKERLAEANARIEADAPKVAFADSVSCSKSEILIRELAKMMTQNGVDIGEKRLFEQLRRDGYLINKPGGDYNSPTQRSMELGVMRVDEVSIAKSDGNVILRRTPKITGKGQIYFMTRYGRG